MEDEKSNIMQTNYNNHLINKQISYNNNKREFLDESHFSSNSEINMKKFDSELQNRDRTNSKEHNDSNINYRPEKTEQAQKLDTIAEETNNHVEEMKKGSYNIMVAVRCRPLSSKEKDFSEFEIVKIIDKKVVILIDPYEYNGHSEIFKNRSREQQYAFDYAFNKNTSQLTLFNDTVKFLLDGVVNGYNATVFAYGATGAGKTYTMLGTEDEEGIMVLTLKELFDKINFYSSDRDYKVKLWYIEIYNENIRDLLSSVDEYLDLREDPNKGISISNISELNVTSCKDIMQLLKKGNKNRTQEATNANETSSRSHAILQVQVEYKDKVTGLEAEIKVGKLSLIDLAGSERASATQNRGIRLIEGANINRSLLTLGNCINALCEANEKGTKPYVPYRDSKLTRLLKDSLGGNSRTVMIANVSPSVSTFDDTYNTLKYANRAKNIKTQVQRNVLNVQYHISNYNQIISNLKNEIFELKAQLAKKDPNYNMVVNNNNLNNFSNINSNPESKYSSSNNTNIYNVDLKKEENKDNSKVNQMPNLPIIFEKAVSELKNHLHEELALKNRIVDQEQEIINLNNFLNVNRKNLEDINTNNNLNLQNFNSDNSNQKSSNENIIQLNPNNISQLNNTNNNNDEILVLNTEPNKDDFDTNRGEKDNLLLNQNNSVIGSGNNNTESNNYEFIIILKDKENQLAKLKKSQERNSEKLAELFKKRETLLNIYLKNGIKDFYFEYLKSLVKSHNLKLYIIDNKIKDKYNDSVIEVKEDYIVNLENQLKFRDDIFKTKNIAIEPEETEKLKSLEQLKKEYTIKLPPIIISKKNKNLNIFNSNSVIHKKEYEFGEHYEKISSLPQIAGNSANNASATNTHLNSILSDIKNINNNIIKIENDYRKKEKSKLRNADYPPNPHTQNNNHTNNNNNNITKLNQARNYSQGVRNLNFAAINNNHNYQNYQSPSTYANAGSTNNTGNYYQNLNQKLQQDNLALKKKLKPALTQINNQNHNNSKVIINRDIHSEKSFSVNPGLQNNNNLLNNNNNNISDNEVYLVDLENSADEYDSNLRRLYKNNGNSRERKASARPVNTTGNHINIRDEEKLYSPFKREFNKFNSNYKRDESLTRIEPIPYVRKKDLNVFLVEKSKSKPRKIPFK